MVMQMAYMATETRVMNGGFQHPIAMSIPFILTLVIIYRNQVSFANKRFILVLGSIIVWSILQIITKSQFSTKQIGLYVSLCYVIFTAYVHVQVFGKSLLRLYEYCMVIMSKIAIPLWLISNFIPSTQTLFRSLPSAGYGKNFLYLYCWMDPNMGQTLGSITRNAGCSWEPGRFAVMLCLAITINIFYRGVTLKDNKNLIWLLVALLSTFSTTGYTATFILLMLFFIKEFNAKYIIGAILVTIPLLYGATKVSFLGEKLSYHIYNQSENIDFVNSEGAYYEEADVFYRMDRFPSLFFEYENLKADVLLGYGRDRTYAKMYKTVSTQMTTTGGLVQMLSVYGIILGFFLYLILWKSSTCIAYNMGSTKTQAIFVFFLLSLVSYPLFEFPIFSAIWLFGYFKPDEDEYETLTDEELNI